MNLGFTCVEFKEKIRCEPYYLCKRYLTFIVHSLVNKTAFCSLINEIVNKERYSYYWKKRFINQKKRKMMNEMPNSPIHS